MESIHSYNDVTASPGDGPPFDEVVKRWAQTAIAFWNRPILRSKRAVPVLLLVLTIICCLRAFVGLAGIKLYGQDVFAIVDGAWRTMNGQRPHTDFYSGLGPLAYLPCALGLTLTHGIEGYSDAQAAFGFVLGMWTFLIARNRLQNVATMLMCLFVVLLSLTPTILGHSAQLLTPASSYNRYGYAFLAILMIEALCPARDDRSMSRFLGGFSTGALIALLLFLKISYFVEAVVLLLGLTFWRKQVWQRWLGILAGFATLFVCFVAYLNFDLLSMIKDLSLISASRHFPVGSVWTLLYSAERDLLPFAAFLTATIMLLWKRQGTPRYFQIMFAAVVVCGVGVLALVSNGGQTSRFPLNVAFVLILLDSLVHSTGHQEKSVRDSVDALVVLTLAAGAMMVLFFPILNDTVSLGDGVFQRIVLTRTARSHKQFDSPRLAGFLTLEEYAVDDFNEGADLLRQYRNPGDTLTVLDFSNPFPFALGIPPPHGGTTWLQWQVNFDSVHQPTGEWLMGSANLVLLPKEYVEPRDNDNIPRVFGPYLHSHYRQIADSKHWYLYRRAA